MNEPVTIDSEFQSLIPPLSSEEFQQLTENCKRDGILDSLKVWNGILIDGHNRYRIAEEWDLNYQTEKMDFPDREAVVRWIILNQFGRRNLSAYDRSVLALKLKPIIAEKAKEKQVTHTEQGYQKSDKAEHTTKELAKVAGVSHDTIHKVETIEQKASEPLKQQVKSGEKSINQAYNEIRNKEIKRLPTAKEYREQVQERHDDFKEQKTVSLEDIRQDQQDKDFLGDEVKRDILKATERVNELYVMVMEKEIDISLLTKNGKTKVLHEISECQRQLGIIQEKIERSR